MEVEDEEKGEDELLIQNTKGESLYLEPSAERKTN